MHVKIRKKKRSTERARERGPRRRPLGVASPRFEIPEERPAGCRCGQSCELGQTHIYTHEARCGPFPSRSVTPTYISPSVSLGAAARARGASSAGQSSPGARRHISSSSSSPCWSCPATAPRRRASRAAAGAPGRRAACRARRSSGVGVVPERRQQQQLIRRSWVREDERVGLAEPAAGRRTPSDQRRCIRAEEAGSRCRAAPAPALPPAPDSSMFLKDARQGPGESPMNVDCPLQASLKRSSSAPMINEISATMSVTSPSTSAPPRWASLCPRLPGHRPPPPLPRHLGAQAFSSFLSFQGCRRVVQRLLQHAPGQEVQHQRKCLSHFVHSPWLAQSNLPWLWGSKRQCVLIDKADCCVPGYFYLEIQSLTPCSRRISRRNIWSLLYYFTKINWNRVSSTCLESGSGFWTKLRFLIGSTDINP